jgi:hypothetical protein
MNRSVVFLAATLITAFVMGCSSGAGGPMSGDLTADKVAGDKTQTHLWGYYDVYVDFPSQTVTAVLNRNAMFSVNVVKFLNANPLSFATHLNGVKPFGTTAIDIDMDITLSHPFPGHFEYNGYDVRGIFIGNGSGMMGYNNKLIYAVDGTSDQMMCDFDQDFTPSDPHYGKTGNPDGYTRWWNPTEFTSPTMFGYLKGIYASQSFDPNATLNPYKYFADGLAVDGDARIFLEKTKENGVFRAGHSNTRNYYIRFPVSGKAKFAYAVLASWKGIKYYEHPANAPDAVAVSAVVTPDVYFINPSIYGGDLKLDLTVFDWDSKTVAGVMTDYKIVIESSVMSSPYIANVSQMTSTGSGANWYSYHVECKADHVTKLNGNEFWVILEDQNNTYKNDFGFTNLCGDDKLAAFFRNDLYVSDTVLGNQDPIVDSGVDGNPSPVLGSSEIYTVTAHDPDGDTLSYFWTVTDKETGIADPSYINVPGGPAGSLTVDWSIISGVDAKKKYDISCNVTDGKSLPVAATTLTVKMAYEVTVTVTSIPVWTNTNIILLPGDKAVVHDATGLWSWGGGGDPTGPEGDPKPDGVSDEWIPDGMHGELIGYIGPTGIDPFMLIQGDPGLFAVGAGSVEVAALDTGETALWLGFNDDYISYGYSDNYGSMEVKILIY